MSDDTLRQIWQILLNTPEAVGRELRQSHRYGNEGVGR